ncbi:MAG: hypothetical protein LQ350_000775 [Teloschistes chrysophthalmus]|nr:MAG: hypothetical protein LQ350_000775 [Niorma chrysophthalma]
MGQLGDLSPQASVAVGIFVGLASTSIQSLGLTLQRKSHILEDEKEEHHPRRPPFRRRRWQLGMLMFIVSNLVGSSIQITTLPLPVLSTLQASGLVFNSICATLILGEPFTRWSLGGTVLVCAGAILIATFGAIGEPAHSLNQLLALLGRRQFILWMVATAIAVVAIIIAAKAIRWMNPKTNHSPRMRLLRGMAYGCISGILSAHSLLVAKSAVELLVRTIVDRHNQFNRWQSWIILLTLLALALSQLYYLHRGLKLCSTSILYPFVFCVYNIIAILDGLIYFRQTSRLSLLHALLIALGTLILLVGVLALSWRLNDPNTARPAAPQTPLTPGMGFVDESPLTSETEETSLLLDTDEEAATATHQRPSSNGKPPTPILKTPTARDNDILSATKPRRKSMTETEEILEELEDDTLTELFSPTLQQQQHQHRRRSSARSTPSRSVGFQPEEAEQQSDERTALLARSSTGRSYQRRRRRVSEPNVGGSSRWPRASSSRRESSQEALGGWWKMGWWGGRAGEGGGGAGDGRLDGGGGGSGVGR